MHPSPVFVFGQPGSGASRLLEMLDAHPELYAFPREVATIPQFAARLPEYGNLDDNENFVALWHDFRDQGGFRRANHGDPPPLPGDWVDHERTLAGVIDETFAYFARNHGKERWCTGSPRHAWQVETLAGLFPGACFVHLIRDGRSHAASRRRRWGEHPQRAILRWREAIAAARAQATAAGACYLEIQQADLIDAPEPPLRRVCEALRVPFVPAMLRPDAREVLPWPTRAGTRWQDELDASLVRRLEWIAGGTLAALGYELSETADKTAAPADHDPPAWRLRLWCWHDQGRAMLRRLSRRLRHPRRHHSRRD